MPWKEKSTVDLKREFSLRAIGMEIPFTDLCREYGISTKTGYKWKERFLREGMKGLEDRSRRPHSSPTGLPEDVVCEIVKLKQAHMSWGPRKIRVLYGRANPGKPLPSDSSFKRVLAKTGLIKKRRKRRSKDGGQLKTKVEVKEPNDLWTVDFKGWWYTPNGERCEPLTIRDEFSRYMLCVSLPGDATTESVQGEFERVFKKYGLPGAIRSDNGRPFAVSSAPLGLSRLSAWWLALGIDLDRIDLGRPDQNGGHERMHRDIADELERKVSGDLRRHAQALEIWRQTFNNVRPHESLGMKCPADVYRRSDKLYQGTPEHIEYPSAYLERKVNATGAIRLNGTTIPLTSALRGWNVGLKANGHRTYTVYFIRTCLGVIDMSTQSFRTMKPKKGGEKK